MATKLNTRAIKFANINGKWINVNQITSIEGNVNSTIIYFQERNLENQGYIEIFGMTPDQVMNDIIADLNGDPKSTPAASSTTTNPAEIAKFIREEI